MNILFLEKVFLKKRKSDKLRGVELFNISFINDLLQLGNKVCLVAHESWKSCFDEAINKENFKVKYYKRGHASIIGARGVLGFFKEKINTIFLANAGDTLLLSMIIAKILRIGKKQVLLAHREPSKAFVKASKFVKVHAVSVNKKIASHFDDLNLPLNEVYYGIKNADAFLNLPIKKAHGKVTFGVVGDLDNKWKGADIAIEAFRNLPFEVSKMCELKLASYTKNMPTDLPANVKAFSWMPYNEIIKFFDSLDVLIVPSYDEEVMRETFSQAMVQGMLSGLPILANDLPILNEKLDEGGGFTFSTLERLCEKITQLVFNQPLREFMGDNARKVATKRYIWDSAKMSSWF